MFDNLYFYNDLEYGSVFESIASAADAKKNISIIIDFAEKYGASGNIFKFMVVYSLIKQENPFSLACEWKIDVESDIYSLALKDFDVIKKVFHMDFQKLSNRAGEDLGVLENYKSVSGNSLLPKKVVSAIKKLVEKLDNSKSVEEFTKHISEYYNKNGAGDFGLYSGFRLDELNPSNGILPIYNTEPATFDKLIGYEYQKEQIIENTKSFIAGRSANNVMLFGDSGTGKSTCIKAVLNEFSEEKLRMIEVYKYQFSYITMILRKIIRRNYKFIIYMDDLSFEENETEYKYLKAIIEGGLEARPENVLMYATSNRRHLIREQWKDRSDVEYDDVHRSDTMEEKLSLAYRFGVSVFFPSPSSQEFKTIVKGIAARNGIEMEEEKLLDKAHKWELRHGGLSGRTAQQFVDYIKGKK